MRARERNKRERKMEKGKIASFVLCCKHSSRRREHEVNPGRASWDITVLHLLCLQLGEKPILLTAILADPDKINSWYLILAAGQLILPHNPFISLAIHLFGTCILPCCCSEMALQGVGPGECLEY